MVRLRIGSRLERTAAPSSAPVRLPIPPKMTIAMIDREIEKPNRPGVDSWKNAASRPPAKPAIAAVMANTTTLKRNTFLPSARVAMSSSRMPLRTRPYGDSPIRQQIA